MGKNINIIDNINFTKDYILNDKDPILDYYDGLVRQGYVNRFELEKKSSIAHMGEIVTSTKEKPIVGTMALATCNGIIFYDRKNKKAWVGHGPASSSITTLITMFNIVIKEVIGDLEYCIILGWDNVHNHNLKTTEEMLAYLRKNCPKNIRLIPMTDLEVKQDNRANPSYEFAINAETGKSVTYDLFYEEEGSLSNSVGKH